MALCAGKINRLLFNQLDGNFKIKYNVTTYTYGIGVD